MNLTDRLLRSVFVPKCTCCRSLLDIENKSGLCNACLDKWQNETMAPCPTCRMRQSECNCPIEGCESIDGSVHLFRYYKDRYGVGKSVVLAMKERNLKDNFEFVSDRLVEALEVRENTLLAEYRINKAGSVIVNVPRRRIAKRRGGYDQAEKLAALVSQKWGVEHYNILQNRGRGAQKGLDRYSRMASAKSAYRINPGALKNGITERLVGRQVILVDDIMTSGATMEVCAALLKSIGASRVIALTVGRTYNKE